jgi:hypothetical protein
LTVHENKDLTKYNRLESISKASFKEKGWFPIQREIMSIFIQGLEDTLEISSFSRVGDHSLPHCKKSSTGFWTT